jgi:hypothetical protein
MKHGLALRRIQVGEVGLGRRRGHRSIVAAASSGFCRDVEGATEAAPSSVTIRLS